VLSGAAAMFAILALSSNFAALLNRPGISIGISVLSLYAFSVILSSSIESSLLGLGRYEDTALMGAVRIFTRVSTALSLALLGFGYLAVLWGLSLGYAAGALVGLLILLRRSPPARPELSSMRELISYSLPLYFPALASSTAGQVIAGFLAVNATDYEMGNLSVATALLTPINLLIGALSTAAFSSLPLLLDGGERLRLAVEKSISYTNTIVIPTALGFATLASPIVYLLYGSSYGVAPFYLLLLLIPYAYNALAASAMTLYANVVGNTKFTGAITLIDVSLRVPTAIALISRLGILGYLLTPLIVNPITATITLLLGKRKLGFLPSLRRNLAVALWSLAGFTAALPARLISDYLAAAIYVAVLAATAKFFVSKGEALEIVELAKSMPIVGYMVHRVGKAVVEKLM